MDILNIQALIKEGKIVKAEEIDPSKAYIQIGVFQPGNRQNGSGNANAFAPYVIQLDQVVNTPNSTDVCQTKFGIDPRFLGPAVYFEKLDYVDKADIIIPNKVEITRANNQGLYNQAVESGYNVGSPHNTAWNSIYVDPNQYGEGNISNVENRTYDIWLNSVDHNPPGAIDGLSLIMSAGNDQFFLIKMLKWTPNNGGGGFAYIRQEILTPNKLWDRPSLSPEVVDKVSPYLTLKRDDSKGIYNAITEKYYDDNGDISPKGTRWNSVYTDPTNYGFADLTNVENRVYSTWKESVNASPPNAAKNGLELIMHDVADNKYYKVQFLDWGPGGDDGLVFMRRSLIPLNCGVTFASGKKMNDLPSGGSTACCPVIDINGNTIIDNTSDNIVPIPPGVEKIDFTQNIPDFSGMLIVNDHYAGGVEMWICGGGTCTLVSSTTATLGGGKMTINGSNGYDWRNFRELAGPFTFTVVKTRNGS